MKRIGRLFDTLVDFHNLAFATWRAAIGKRQRPEVRAFLDRLDENLADLTLGLREGSFRFGPYRSFSIRDPKTRLIHAPSFADRVVHHAIVAATAPTFERGAIAHTYACRPGRGQHAALRRAKGWLRRDDFFLKIDISRYYDSIDHERLMRRMARRFRERRLLRLFGHLIASYSKSPGKGLPIGALTSQYLSNFFLDPLDHFIHQGLGQRRYLRYMDDLLLVGERETLLRARDAIVQRLAADELAPKFAIVHRSTEGVPFLGFVIYPDRVRLNRQGRCRLRRKLRVVERSWERGYIGEAELQARATALFAHARFGDDVAWRRTVAAFSRHGEEHEPEPGGARWVVEQHGQELPRREPQQERAVQPQQEQRLPGLSGSQYDGPSDDGSQSQPADNAPSPLRRLLLGADAPPASRRRKTTGKTSASADIQLAFGWSEPEKGDAEAPVPRSLGDVVPPADETEGA